MVEIKLLRTLLEGLEFGELGKKWVPKHAATVAYFSATIQPFLIFMKLLATILSR